MRERVTLIGANQLKELSKRDLRVLQAIEVGMIKSEYVEIDIIAKIANQSIPDTMQNLKKCHKLKLVHRWTGHFVGYELTIHGYDSLGLNALYERGIIQGIGREKGVGKESVVYYALTPNDEEVVIKLHRVGFTSFHQVRKKRRYTASKRHISELYASRLSAEAEAKWLKQAYKLKLNVPKIFSTNRHIIVEELIDGIDLAKLANLPDPVGTMESLLDFIDIAWNKGKFVHGDLSEHNVIMSYDEVPYVIDFPQAVDQEFESALEYLKRDIKNVLTYFQRKHNLQVDFDKIFESITNPKD